MKIKIPKIIRKYLKAGAISGLVMILGFVVIVVIIKMLTSIFDPVYRLFNQYLPGSKNAAIDSIYLIIFSLLTTFMLFIGLGAAITAVKNKRGGITKIISSLIVKLPFVKHFLVPEETLSTENNQKSENEALGLVVRCRSVFGYETLGFVMKKFRSYFFDSKKWATEYMVLIPNSPLPWSGYIQIFPEGELKIVGVLDTDEITKLKKIIMMSRIEGAKIIISCGLTAPAELIFASFNTPLSEIQKILKEHK